MHKVFVYGTVKRGFPNDVTGSLGFNWIGRFRTVDAFPLVVGGKWYSPYLIAEPGAGHRVFGEILEIDDQGLAKLDLMEGTHVPEGYRRMAIAIENNDDGAPFDAWTYVKDRDAIEDIHSEPMAEYALDSRYVIPSKRSSNF